MLEGVRAGGELLWVEGQGSLTHPQYSGATLGLFHGSAPAALVLCHVPGHGFVNGRARFPMPSLAALVELHERTALIARPSPVAAIALNTRGMEEDAARAAVAAAEAETGPPADDPVQFRRGEARGCRARAGWMSFRVRCKVVTLSS